MKKLTLQFGLVAGLVIVGYSLVVMLLFGNIAKLSPKEFQMVEVLGFLRYIILLLAVFLAMRAVRKMPETNPGFWPVVRTGILVALVIALLVGLMEFGYILSNPEFYDQYGEMYLSRMKADGAPEAEIAAAQQQIEDYAFMANPVVSGVFYFIETALVGSVAALIMGIFLRKKAEPSS